MEWLLTWIQRNPTRVGVSPVKKGADDPNSTQQLTHQGWYTSCTKPIKWRKRKKGDGGQSRKKQKKKSNRRRLAGEVVYAAQGEKINGSDFGESAPNPLIRSS